MLRRMFVVWLFALLLPAGRWSAASDSPAASPEPALKSIYAGIHRLDEFKTAQTKALVLAFLDTECPIAQKQLPRLKEVHERLADEGVSVLGIYSHTRINIWN